MRETQTTPDAAAVSPSGFDAPPSLDDFEIMARAAHAEIPAILREPTRDILFRIDDFPDEEVARDMGLESPFDLLGLYQGVDLTQKSVADPSPEPDIIYLYRRPILDYWCETGESLPHLIRHVLIHEIGHHFGLSDDDMHALEDQTDL
ncbi:MAG: metallopeptidase family protein [Alphaproteobacteria bacterium]|nr:metallopeptidase family protein [Alphaproteobacteria bacterium]